MANSQSQRTKVFTSYSHKDKGIEKTTGSSSQSTESNEYFRAYRRLDFGHFSGSIGYLLKAGQFGSRVRFTHHKHTWACGAWNAPYAVPV